MKKTTFFLMVALCAAPISFTGCGGSGETKVIEQDADAPRSGMSEEDQKKYEEAMKQQRGGPGN